MSWRQRHWIKLLRKACALGEGAVAAYLIYGGVLDSSVFLVVIGGAVAADMVMTAVQSEG